MITINIGLLIIAIIMTSNTWLLTINSNAFIIIHNKLLFAINTNFYDTIIKGTILLLNLNPLFGSKCSSADP